MHDMRRIPIHVWAIALSVLAVIALAGCGGGGY
jgi:hypothetical protein